MQRLGVCPPFRKKERVKAMGSWKKNQVATDSDALPYCIFLVSKDKIILQGISSA